MKTVNGIGLLMLAAPFIALFVYGTIDIGWRVTGIIFAIVIGVVAWVSIAAYLAGRP